MQILELGKVGFIWAWTRKNEYTKEKSTKCTVVFNTNMKSACVCLHIRESKRVIKIVHEKMNGFY